MSIPVKLAIMRNLTSLIERTPVNELNPYDLTGSVFRGILLHGAEAPATYINIIEAPRQDPGRTTRDGNARINNWELYLQGFAEADAASFTTDNIYLLSAAVEVQLQRMVARQAGKPNALYQEDYYLGYHGSGIAEIEIGPQLVRSPDVNANANAFFYQTIVFKLARPVGQPYVDDV